jgi:benzoyl-CoA reductase/2-hydroxyglutaryl-CoA dehydratase subunit BcrC/BadD/HgdB
MENRMIDRYKKNISRISSVSLKQLMSARDLPREFSYFADVLRRTFVGLEEKDQEYIGCYCVMVPEEIIYAFGYRPQRLCAGHSVAALIGDGIVPRDACPLLKAATGFHAMRVMPIYQQCILAVLPMTCDGKRKSAALLSQYLPVIPLPLAMNKSEEDGFEQNLRYMHALVKSISMATGRKLSNAKLIDAYKSINAARKEAATLYELLSSEHPPVAGSQVMAVINSYFYDIPEKWTKHVRILNTELSQKKETMRPPKREKPRILVAGSPIGFPNYKLPLLIENLGAQIVGDETCMSGRLLYSPVQPESESTDDILRALTARYVSACKCPVFDQAEDRIYGLAEKLRRTKAEGVVYHVLRGCTPYDFELSMVEHDAKLLNIPVLRVETDFSAEDVEQVRIRLEAFIEMIEQRR